jgi:type IV pilus assembly protein PilB
MGVTATNDTIFSNVDLAQFDLEPDVLQRIPRSLALRYDILTLSSEGNQITIALPDANDSDTIDRVRLVTGMHVRAISVEREAIRTRLRNLYSQETTSGVSAAHGQSSSDAPAIRLLDEVHKTALAARASDIHLEPCRSGGRVRQRVDGILSETKRIDTAIYSQVVSRVKLLAGMDIADRRQPQDGRYAIDGGEYSIDVRVSSMPTIDGEKLVVRLLDRCAHIPTLQSIGMPLDLLREFQKRILAPHGFVIICGPTGSGKTTTLYAAMAERNIDAQNLCSAEDPVEIYIPGVAQVQVNPRAGVTFASALRGFLRQDPNVIMIGEMRDEETAKVALSASLSGQLVLTSLHSNDAPRALERLGELGVTRHAVAAGLTAVISQRLVRKLCVHCRVPDRVEQQAAWEFGVEAGTPVYRSLGCAKCGGSGYFGRTAVFEGIFIDRKLRDLVTDGCSTAALVETARACGYEPLQVDGIRRVVTGETTFDELRRVLPTEARLQMR